ncbi:MAG TPA: superoxide dismutase family protein [Ornithinibacter sp.]|nr:superoxide dismutase family protein [Ornithinibacter sp.]
MSITSRRLLPLAAIVALIALPATANAGDLGPVVRATGPMADLQPATAGPFDAATAAFQLVASARGSHGVLRVAGVGASADGATFGAHLHVGPCVAGNGPAAGGHYNTDVEADILPPDNEISEDTEMWLDITVDDGAATATASVPFVPVPGTRSVVVHALETDHHTGVAGARLACLPVVW